jgi:type III pantothenate kinase
VILAIDAGNTRIKWGIHDGHAWIASGAVDSASPGRLAQAWSGAPRPTRAIASNVAGDAVGAELESACARSGIALRVIRSEGAQLGVVNGYEEPAQLGSDRWAALIAAHRLEPGHKLVVNAGTALTIDALAADGRFLGGLIVPGPALMRRSLDRGTAGLRLTEGRFEDFPRSTPDAITSGAIQAAAGAVARIRDAMAARGLAPARALLSGGAAGTLAPHLSIACAIHENLVLDGLALIARHT